MKFCNSHKGTVKPLAKRGAPAIPLDEFKQILADYYNMSFGASDVADYYLEAIEKEKFIKMIFQNRKSIDCPEFYSELKFVSDDPASKAVNSVDPANNLLGIRTLSTGIPIYGFLMGGESEKPFFAIIYWNGNRLRLFVPEFGNTINIDFFTGFGSEAYSAMNDPSELVEEYEDFSRKGLDEISCKTCSPEEMPFMAPGIVYCMKNGFATTEEEAYEVMNTVSWEKILEEITDFIEESDEDGSEMVVAEPEEEEEVEEEEDEEAEEEEEMDFPTLEEFNVEFNNLDCPEMTKRMDFCNNKRSKIKIGKQILSDISPEEFVQQLNVFYDSSCSAIYDYLDDPIFLAQKMVKETDLKIDLTYATIKPDESKMQSDDEPGLLGFQVMESGIPFLGIEVGDDEACLFIALFWDGKAIVPYVPNYGNTFNTDLRTFLGKEAMSTESLKRKYSRMYEVTLGEKTADASDCFDSKKLMECYFKSIDVPNDEIPDYRYKGSWNAILEDMSFAILTKN